VCSWIGETDLQTLGHAGDIPVPGDYNGDGKTDIAIFRPSTGTWYIVTLGGELVRQLQWGAVGDIPVPADYDADGAADVAIWRLSDGGFYIHRMATVACGIAGDIPLFKRPSYPGYPF
jgi:hypothetical protein